MSEVQESASASENKEEVQEKYTGPRPGIFWLASYPKSGNTWFRTFLTNYQRDAEEPADINALNRTPIASARGIIDDFLGVGTSELTQRDIDNVRRKVYEQLSNNLDHNIYMKIHDSYHLSQRKEALFGGEGIKGALYLLRNPLDVCVSFANHNSITPSQMVPLMNREQYSLARSFNGLNNQVRQWLKSWKGHALSWIDQKDIPVKVIRYEDMKQKPYETFMEAVNFLELPYEPARLKKAIDYAQFEKLQKQEEEKSFREKPSQCGAFFRKGKVGSWREVLSVDEVNFLINYNRDFMQRFGYLDEEGKLKI